MLYHRENLVLHLFCSLPGNGPLQLGPVVLEGLSQRHLLWKIDPQTPTVPWFCCGVSHRRRPTYNFQPILCATEHRMSSGLSDLTHEREVCAFE